MGCDNTEANLSVGAREQAAVHASSGPRSGRRSGAPSVDQSWSRKMKNLEFFQWLW